MGKTNIIHPAFFDPLIEYITAYDDGKQLIEFTLPSSFNINRQLILKYFDSAEMHFDSERKLVFRLTGSIKDRDLYLYLIDKTQML
jgi:hypothetical protein